MLSCGEKAWRVRGRFGGNSEAARQTVAQGVSFARHVGHAVVEGLNVRMPAFQNNVLRTKEEHEHLGVGDHSDSAAPDKGFEPSERLKKCESFFAQNVP